ncbi:unnamed protein product [Ectocarpus sp. 4 AP-2014]
MGAKLPRGYKRSGHHCLQQKSCAFAFCVRRELPHVNTHLSAAWPRTVHPAVSVLPKQIPKADPISFVMYLSKNSRDARVLKRRLWNAQQHEQKQNRRKHTHNDRSSVARVGHKPKY